MRRPFDQLGKTLGKEALEDSGRTVAQFEISSRDAQHADLWHVPDPARGAERARLGLLGRLASVLCLIEIYAHAPSGEEVRACLIKHLVYWQDCTNRRRAANRLRKARKPAPVPQPGAKPFLWLIAPTMSAPMLEKLGAKPMAGWPPGVYTFGFDILRVGFVVANELPRERSTLLVRIMAAGPGLPQAIAELSALPAEAHERILAEDVLVSLQRVLVKVPSRTPEEEEFIVRMQSTWEKARKEGRREGQLEGEKKGRQEGHKEGLLEGEKKGRAEGEARALLTVLRVRGMAVSSATRERILAEKNPSRLERWLKKALQATSLAQVLDEPR